MRFPRRQFLHLAAGAAAVPTVSRIARAQTYPARPITIVVPFPTGGALELANSMGCRQLPEGAADAVSAI